jgi:methyltransferase FkbM-like protein
MDDCGISSPMREEEEALMVPPKALGDDFVGRFREIISDPLNLLIERAPLAGTLQDENVVLHNGNLVNVVGDDAYYGSFSRILVFNRGVHEPLEEYVFQEVLKGLRETPLMIELGAYWAHYSMWLQSVRPRATNIMVEPDPRAILVGKRNFLRNTMQGEFIADAVGNGRFEVDAFLQSRSIDQIDILHTDIQGAEVEMLAGARRSLSNHTIDYLFVSTHSQELHAAVSERLVTDGYRIEVSSDFQNETTSFDGFILGSSPKAAQIFDRFVPLGRTQICQSSPHELLASLGAVSAQRLERVISR